MVIQALVDMNIWLLDKVNINKYCFLQCLLIQYNQNMYFHCVRSVYTKKDRLQNQIWNRSVNFKNIRTEFVLFDYIFGYNSFLSFCNLMVFMQNNAVCNSWYECKNKYNRNKSFDVFACPYFLDNIGNPRYCLLPLSSFKIFKMLSTPLYALWKLSKRFS